MKTANRLTIFLAILGIVSLFQNCSKVSFSATNHTNLAQGTDTTNNVPNSGGTDTNPPNNSAPPPHSDGDKCDDKDNDSDEVLCYLEDGHGESERIGGSPSMVLDVSHAIPGDACMTPKACLGAINDYLNHTGGDLNGHYGPSQANHLQYTSAKYNGVCGHNPNVSHLNDKDIDKDLSNLQAAHQ